FVDVRAGRVTDDLGQVGVLLDKTLHLAASQTKHVLPNQDLRIAVRTGANADGRDLEFTGHLARQITRNHLQHHAEGSGLFDSVRIVQQPLRIIATTLHSIAPELVLTLWGEPDVAHDGDTGVGDLADLGCDAYPTLELHRVAATFLHEADRGLEGLGRPILVRAEGKITDHEGSFGGFHYGPDQR